MQNHHDDRNLAVLVKRSPRLTALARPENSAPPQFVFRTSLDNHSGLKKDAFQKLATSDIWLFAGPPGRATLQERQHSALQLYIHIYIYIWQQNDRTARMVGAGSLCK
jgi:hypothetical protein